ncbi:MAG TPA: hypothetical protein VF081_02920 [Solirubrobacterales bacterium]
MLALGASGCGGEGQPAGDASALAGPTADAGAATRSAPSPAARCATQLRGFLASMDRLRERLVVGVSYRQYIGELKAVRVPYDKLPVGRLAAECLTAAAAPAERSLNKYLEAANVWGECVEVPGCRSSSIEPELQRKWRQGADLLSSAEDAARPPGAPTRAVPAPEPELAPDGVPRQ